MDFKLTELTNGKHIKCEHLTNNPLTSDMLELVTGPIDAEETGKP